MITPLFHGRNGFMKTYEREIQQIIDLVWMGC